VFEPSEVRISFVVPVTISSLSVDGTIDFIISYVVS
jgi:hypothetical protein